MTGSVAFAAPDSAAAPSPRLRGDVAAGNAFIAAPPLDYSFKELKNCAEIETEEPRGGKRRPHTALEREALAAAAAAEDAKNNPSENPPEGSAEASAVTSGQPSPVSPSSAAGAGAQAGAGVAGSGASAALQLRASTAPAAYSARRRKVTVAVKLNNNLLETVNDLPLALDLVMDDPLRNCQWIDLSFNRLTSIEPALLQFQQVKALYLHKNLIKSLPSIERLRKLPLLISLTTNGNPIEGQRSYRNYVIGALPRLRLLDHSSIIEEETNAAGAWFKAHLKRQKARREKLEEAYLDSLRDG